MRLDSDTNTSNGTSRPYSNGTLSPMQKATFSSNGARKSPAHNGDSSANGYTPSRPTYFGHDREEVTRILIQCLTELGYNDTATKLSNESGFALESPSVAAFRHAVLEGAWTEAEELLFGGSTEEGGVSINGNGLALQEGVDQNVMRFWIRQQKFLELLEKQDTGRALMVIRSELTPLYQDTNKLHFLSSLLMCESNADLMAKAEWDGAGGDSRQLLLSNLSKWISPSVMLPEHRLAVLLEQVKRGQIANCIFHNTAASPSLYQDHTCDRSGFPMHMSLELTEHSGEVWGVLFSHNGKYLASCGSEGSALIYDVENFTVMHTLMDHDDGVGSMSWSPDDSMLVTCSPDKKARLWDVLTGELLAILPPFTQPVSSCVWAPDGRSFIIGHLDKHSVITQWDTRGNKIYDWGAKHRVRCLAMAPDGSRLAAMNTDTIVTIFNYETRKPEYELRLEGMVGSLSIAANSRWLLVNKVDGEVLIIDMDSRLTVQKFRAHTQINPQFNINAAFGGANEHFVIQGSESGKIYIWHKENGQLIETLDGHKKSCNSVSWNPTDPQMFASAGDDGKVRIWTTGDPRLKSRTSNGASRS